LLVAWLVCGACAVERPDPAPAQTDAGEPAPTGYAKPAQRLFVAPDGTGDACSETEPCTIEQAKAKAERLIAAADGGIEVLLGDGVYRLTEPLRFSSADSGRPEHAIEWRAQPGARPILSGGRRVTGWVLADADQHLWRAAVPASLRTRQLYIDGKRLPIAQGAPPIELTGQSWGYIAADETLARWRNPRALEFVYPGGNGDWTESRCRVGAVISRDVLMSQPCWNNITQRPALHPPAYDSYNMSVSTTPARIENAFELLQLGQWYLDRAEPALYLRSADIDPNRADVEVPVLEQLLVGDGTLDEPVHDLRFRGLTFAYATWHAPSTELGFAEIQANITLTSGVGEPPQGTCKLSEPPGTCPFGANTRALGNVSWRAARNIELVRDRFEHLGATALVFEYGSQSNRIEGNTFSDVSGGGISLGNTDDPHPSDVGADDREINAHNVIANNVIHDIGVEYPGAVGIMLFVTQDSEVRNNDLHDLPYTAISSGAIGGHASVPEAPDTNTNVNADNRITNNLIYRYMLQLNDGGAIYLEGHQHETVRAADGSIDKAASYAHGLLLSGNVAYHQVGSGNAFYDDIGSQWLRWVANVQWDAPAANGGCVPVGHFEFIGNYHSDGLENFGCGAPLDTFYAGNVRIPREPLARDLPPSILSAAGLEPAFRDLLATQAPQLAYVMPHSGTAARDTQVLIAGSGFDAGTEVRWGDRPARSVNRLSASFLVATAPELAELSELEVRTAAGSVRMKTGERESDRD
jgi:parallel beta-helix repeat protein